MPSYWRSEIAVPKRQRGCAPVRAPCRRPEINPAGLGPTADRCLGGVPVRTAEGRRRPCGAGAEAMATARHTVSLMAVDLTRESRARDSAGSEWLAHLRRGRAAGPFGHQDHNASCALGNGSGAAPATALQHRAASDSTLLSGPRGSSRCARWRPRSAPHAWPRCERPHACGALLRCDRRPTRISLSGRFSSNGSRDTAPATGDPVFADGREGQPELRSSHARCTPEPA